MSVTIDTNTNCVGHLDDLKKRGVTTIGRYYATYGDKRLTKTEAQAISDAGLKLFIVFEDNGSPALNVDRGRNDGQVALRQARFIGQPKGSAIYFALEHLPDGYGPDQVAGLKLYFEGIRRAFGNEYAVGCYSNGTTLTALLDEKPPLIQYAWLSASLGFHGSREFLKTDRWHLLQEVPIDLNWGGVSVDTNKVQHADFGAFTLPPAALVTAEAGAEAGSAMAAVSVPQTAPAIQNSTEPVQSDTKPAPRRDLDYINEMIEKASRLGANVKNAWTAIKLAFGIGVGGTGVVAGAHQVGLFDPTKGNAAVATSWGAQHPWLMLLIGATVVLAVFGGILAVFFPKIIAGIVSAYKDGRYTPPGGTSAKPRGA